MPLVYADRVQETTLTVGIGALTLLGAASTFQGFSVIGVGNTTYYTIVDSTAGTWEVGLGTVGVGSLARTSVLASSNANALVNFGVGTKSVFAVSPATFFTTALSTIGHALINHTGLPGVPAPETFTAVVHATTDHTGITGVPPPEAFTALVHAATNHAGIAGVSGLPTAAIWESNTETLAADKTLTDASPTIQYLNPNGSRYNVVLPAVATANRQLVIYNTAPGAGRLSIKFGAVVLGTIFPGHASRVYSNGLKWSMSAPVWVVPSTAKTSAVLKFGASIAFVVNEYPVVRVQPGSDTIVYNHRVRYRMPSAGTITGGFVTPATSTASFEIRVNNVAQATVPYGNATTTTFVVNVPFNTGDEISIRTITGTGPNNASFCLLADFSSTAGPTAWFGGSNGGAGARFQVFGNDTDAALSGTDIRTSFFVPTAMRLIGFSWDLNTSSNTDSFIIFKNGAAATGAIGVAAFSGQTALDIQLSAGDELYVTKVTGVTMSGNFGLQFEGNSTLVAFASEGAGGTEYMTLFNKVETLGQPTPIGSAFYKATTGGRIRYVVIEAEGSFTRTFTIKINSVVMKVINQGINTLLITEYEDLVFNAGDEISVLPSNLGLNSMAKVQLWIYSE